MEAPVWSTQQLAEYIAAVSTARTEPDAVRMAVERAAEALDADVAAIVRGGEVTVAVGYAEGTAPVAELEAVEPGAVDCRLEVPGAGTCAATAATLDYPPGAVLVLARAEPEGLSREETGLVRGMARVAAMTMRMLSTLDAERAARGELHALAEEQAALRRVATLVARAAPPPAVFAAVTEEAGRLLSADITILVRYEPDGAATSVGVWSKAGNAPAPGYRTPLRGRNVRTLVYETGRAARLDTFGDNTDLPAWTAGAGLQSSVGVPISVEDRLWGVVIVSSTRDEPLPPTTEARLAGFTELVATAIGNAQAHAELMASRARIVAAADDTRRRIERDLHDGAQQRLISIALRLRAARVAVPPDLAELAAELDGVADEATSAHDQLRDYARGIHPAILAEGGLAAALRTLARRSSVPVKLDVRMDTRLPERVEVTAYYVVSEALTNTAKHAHASLVHIEAEMRDAVVRLAVRDDGVGGADPVRGSGLLGLQDRVAAIGGTVAVDSRRHEGTSLLVELPIDAEPLPGPR